MLILFITLLNLPPSPLLADEPSEPFPHQSGWPVTLNHGQGTGVLGLIVTDLDGDGSNEVSALVGSLFGTPLSLPAYLYV
jgi:hypothetical protein